MVRHALSRGVTPLFDEAPSLTVNAARRAHAEHKLAAARLALEGLDADLRQAESDVTKARDEVRSAIEAVMIDEADQLATRIEEVEAEALLLRSRLGGEFSPAGRLRNMTPATRRVIGGAAAFETVMLRDGALSAEAQRANKAWAAFASMLESDSDAELSFDRPASASARAA